MATRKERFVISIFFFATTLLTVGYVAALEQGSRAPAIEGEALSGSFDMRETRGKVVVVDFWASWCEPCGEAMPALDRLYKRYKDHGLVVVGVNVDRNEGNARQFLRRTRVSFPQVRDSNHSLADRYSPPTMPSTYVIDRRGVVRHVHAGYRDGDARQLERQVRDLL